MSCMFAHSSSSPMAPPVKAKKQTSLDSYSRPSTRLAKKETKAKGPGGAAPEASNRPKSKQRKGAGVSDMIPAPDKMK